MSRQKEYDRLTKHFQDGITINDNDIVVADDIFDGVLPDNLTRDDFKKVDHFRSNIVAPLAKVVAERSMEVMGKDKGLKSVTTTLDVYGRDVTININRKAKTADERTQVVYSDRFDEHQAEIDSTYEAIHTAFDTFNKKK